MQRFGVILVLYRRLWPITTATSLLMWSLGGFPTLQSDLFPAFIIAFVWLRTGCQLLIWYLFRVMGQKGLVFYQHFGFSQVQLAGTIYLLDLLLFALWILSVSLLAL